MKKIADISLFESLGSIGSAGSSDMSVFNGNEGSTGKLKGRVGQFEVWCGWSDPEGLDIRFGIIDSSGKFHELDREPNFSLISSVPELASSEEVKEFCATLDAIYSHIGLPAIEYDDAVEKFVDEVSARTRVKWQRSYF